MHIIQTHIEKFKNESKNICKKTVPEIELHTHV